MINIKIASALCNWSEINKMLKENDINDTDIISVQTIGKNIIFYYKGEDEDLSTMQIGNYIAYCPNCDNLFRNVDDLFCPNCESDNLILVSTDYVKNLIKENT